MPEYQPSAAPSASTYASLGLGIPIATVISWALNQFLSIAVPGPVEAAIGAIIATVAGYFFSGGRRADTE